MDKLQELANMIHAGAQQDANAHDLKAITIVIDKDGAFRLTLDKDMNINVVVGVLSRAVVAMACVFPPGFTVDLAQKN